MLDASALLALINQETGADRVAEALSNALISAVNLSEVAGKLVDKGLDERDIDGELAGLDVDVVDFGRPAALLAAALRGSLPRTLSLGDRACLALGLAVGGDVLTADRQWPNLGLTGVKVVSVR